MPKEGATRASVQQPIRVMHFTNADHQKDRTLVHKPDMCETYLRRQSFSLAILQGSYTNYTPTPKPNGVMRDVYDL